jgi:hypothetical protein
MTKKLRPNATTYCLKRSVSKGFPEAERKAAVAWYRKNGLKVPKAVTYDAYLAAVERAANRARGQSLGHGADEDEFDHYEPMPPEQPVSAAELPKPSLVELDWGGRLSKPARAVPEKLPLNLWHIGGLTPSKKTKRRVKRDPTRPPVAPVFARKPKLRLGEEPEPLPPIRPAYRVPEGPLEKTFLLSLEVPIEDPTATRGKLLERGLMAYLDNPDTKYGFEQKQLVDLVNCCKDGWSISKISRIMRISPGTVSNRISWLKKLAKESKTLTVS